MSDISNQAAQATSGATRSKQVVHINFAILKGANA